jgi:hypothetical protein
VLSGGILVTEMLLLPASSLYSFREYDALGSLRLSFGSGEVFRSYRYDKLGRYQSSFDARGVMRHEIEYDLSGSPIY